MSFASARLLLVSLWLGAAAPALAQTKAARPKAAGAKPAAPAAPATNPALVNPALVPHQAAEGVRYTPPPVATDSVYDYVDQFPEFPGGSAGIIRFLTENFHYPPKALRYQVTGKVYCKFVVDTLGRVRQPVITQSLTPDCDSEVVRIVRRMPVFKPGRRQGVAVPVYYSLPVTFDIPDGRPEGWREPSNFAQLLTRAGMIFRYPDGLVETPVVPNPQQPYDFALRHPQKPFEVRFAIRPLDSLLLAYRASLKNSTGNSSLANPNEMYLKEFVFAVLPNISGGESGEPKEFPTDALQYEFGADWAALSVVPLDPAFGQKYKYCSAVAMHKADRADVYIFFLFNKESDLQALFDPSLHALRFQR